VCARLGRRAERIFSCPILERRGQCYPHMMKGNAVGPGDNQRIDGRSRRKRNDVADPNQAFANAFVDALRDILRHERRLAS
jgi:hypothetical protein